MVAEPTIRTTIERMAQDRTPFIGRYRELGTILGELEEGSRILTITGPSGMGKTRLAKLVAGEAATLYEEGGAWFCSLVSCSSGPELEKAVGHALGIPQKQGRELSLAVANRGRILLVLDNLDDVVRDAIPVIRDWLDHSAELQILATSIVPLGIDEEVRFELGPLDLRDAINLYIERANRAWAGSNLLDSEGDTLEDLVGRLDRIPLAIELAAARVRVLSPRALLARMDNRFELLASSRPGRHGSMLKALSLTWSLLNDEEKLTLARISVFVGGFSLEAAEAILSPEDPHRAWDLLDGLRGKALVQVEEQDPPRFSVYESVREFGAMQLEALGASEDSVARHAAWFAQEGERHAARSVGREPEESIRWLETERANLLAALWRSFPDDPGTAARLGIVHSSNLSILAPVILDEALVDSVVDAATRAPEPSLLPRALWMRASARMKLGHVKEAREDAEAGLQRAREIGEKADEVRLLTLSGVLWVMTADIQHAKAELERAVALAEKGGEPILAGIALLYLGKTEELSSDLEASAAFYDRAHAIFRRHGAIALEGTALFAIGVVSAGRDELANARRAMSEARGIFQRLGVRALEADAIMNLGGVEVTAGNYQEAKVFLLEALELERRVGNRRFEALAILNLGILSLDKRELKQAEQHLCEALDIFDEIGDLRYRAEAQWFLAILNALDERRREALRNLEEASAFFEKAADRAGEAKVDVVEGLLELADARVLCRRTPGPQAKALEAQARERLRQIHQSQKQTSEGLIVARRIIERELDSDLEGEGADVGVTETKLFIGPETAWFEAGGERVELLRRTALRRMLHGLAEKHRDDPGTGLSQEELFDIGWTGEKVLPSAAASRVYVGVRTLRSLGLEGILIRDTDGYLLDPEVRVMMADGSEV